MKYHTGDLMIVMPVSKWKRVSERAHKPWDHGIPSTGTNNSIHKVWLPVLSTLQQGHSMTVAQLFSSFVLA
jgi:hypothetical protein